MFSTEVPQKGFTVYRLQLALNPATSRPRHGFARLTRPEGLLAYKGCR